MGAHSKARDPFTGYQATGQRGTWPALLIICSRPPHGGVVEVGSWNGHWLHSCGDCGGAGGKSQPDVNEEQLGPPLLPLDKSSW